MNRCYTPVKMLIHHLNHAVAMPIESKACSKLRKPKPMPESVDMSPPSTTATAAVNRPKDELGKSPAMFFDCMMYRSIDPCTSHLHACSIVDCCHYMPVPAYSLKNVYPHIGINFTCSHRSQHPACRAWQTLLIKSKPASKRAPTPCTWLHHVSPQT